MKYFTPWKIAPTLIVCLLALCAGCSQQAPALKVWAVDDMVRLTHSMPAPEVSPIAGVDYEYVSLTSCANDSLGFQLVVDAQQLPVEQLEVRLEGLVDAEGRPTPHVSAEIFRMETLKLGRRPAWTLRLGQTPPQGQEVYEILLPAGKRGASLRPGKRAAYWFEIRLGHAALPGSYTGTIRLTSDSHGPREIQLRLEVLDLVLPDALPFLVSGGFDHREVYGQFVRRNGVPFRPRRLDRRNQDVREGLGYLRQLMVQAHRDKVDLFDKALRPLFKRGLDGTIQVDWSDYDNIAGPYLDGSAFPDKLPVRLWMLPVAEQWPGARGYSRPDDPAYLDTFDQLTRASVEHLNQIAPGVQFAAWVYRGPVEQDAYETQLRLASVIREADGRAAVLSTLPVPVPREVNWQVPRGFVENTDLLAPPGRWFSPAYDFMALRGASPSQAAGKWLQPAMPLYGPSLSLWAPATDPRSLCWFAMKYRAKGILIPEVLDWTQEPAARAGASRLFYPAEGEVAASATLKRLRRGLSDAGLLWILRQRGKETLAETLTDAMVRYMGLAAAGDHYLDPRMDGRQTDAGSWRLARDLLLREALLAVHPEDLDNRRQALALRLRWDSLAKMTRSVRVERIRAVSHPAPVIDPQDELRLETQLLVDLYNGHTRSAEVVVELGPDKPQQLEPARTALRIEPGARQTAVLTFRHPLPVFVGSGKGSVPVRLTSDLDPPRTLQADLAILTAKPLPRDLNIDGKLDDWPLLPAGSATDFQRLGSGPGQDLEPEESTFAWIARDEDHLYLAFQCNESDPEGMEARSTNFVDYQDLLAIREDLIEILLDPGARAVDTRGLFHLLVKPTGVVVTERGVNTNPPLGGAKPWPVSLRVAAARNDRGWAVELALPLDAFGPDRYRFWGINFIRNRSQGPESSSWSPAARYYYDPRNLGTLVFQEDTENAERTRP